MTYSDKNRQGIIQKHIANGVIVKDTDGLIIENTVNIDSGAVIYGGNRILGQTHIGEKAIIKSGNVIEDSEIGALCIIEKSMVKASRIGKNTTVTMAHVHSGSKIGRDCRVGNFVEIKNSHIGNANKIAHLAYVGDVDMGDYCNVGCGAIFVNYDGKNKHRSIVGNSVFIGSNCNVIAPVKLEDKAYIAAATTVTKDLPSGCMCIGRGREMIKENRSRYGNVANKLFGTDGIRGVYGEKLTDEIAYMTGNFLGYSADNGTIVVGRDTRLSGEKLTNSLINGILDAGSNVIDLGIVTSPLVAFSLRECNANYGVMITASHNPPEYNGIKVFNSDGGKLGELEESEIERHINNAQPIVRLNRGVSNNGEWLKDTYTDKISDFIGDDVNKDIKVVIDVANGGASSIIKSVVDRLGITATILNSHADGKLINVNCGATDTTMLCEYVIKNGADIGIALDGDADRIIAIDEQGNIIDGDAMIYIFAEYFKRLGKLRTSKIACTILSNLGLKNALNELGISESITDVGDHNVVDAMKKEEIQIGGEQSGHIIISDFLFTGDGIFAGAMLIKIMSETNRKLSELNKVVKYPQVSKNLRDIDKSVATSPAIIEQINGVNSYYGGKARLVVRASGTEPVVRIMAEAITEELAEQILELAVMNITKQ